MKTICVTNDKGGVGKTTTALSFSSRLAAKGYRVLHIDADRQGNSTQNLMSDVTKGFTDLDKLYDLMNYYEDSYKCLEVFCQMQNTPKDLSNVLLKPNDDIHDCIYNTKIDNLDIIPCFDESLTVTDMMLKTEIGKQIHNRLRNALRQVRTEYDYVIIDNPPTANTITLNTFVVADEILLVFKSGGFELNGLRLSIKTIRDLKDEYEIDKDFRILFTMVPRGNRPTHKKMKDIVTKLFPKNIFKNDIGFQEAIAGNSTMKNVTVVDTKSRIADDYKLVVDEFLGGAE